MKLKSLSLVCLSLWGAFAQASTLVEFSTGLKGGRLIESVYIGDALLSELRWKIPITPVAKLTLAALIYKDIYIKASYLHPLLVTYSNVIDKDWDIRDPLRPLISYSDSPTEYVKNKEGSLGFYLKLLSHTKHSIALGIDYRIVHMAWNASGGQFINYRTGAVTVWDDSVGVISLSHRQFIPHLTLQYESRPAPWGVKMALGFTPAATINEVDYHVLREKMFHDNFSNVSWLELGPSIFYQGTSGWRVGMDVRANHAFKKRGDILSYYIDDTDMYLSRDIASSTSTTWNVMLSFKCPM